MPHLACLKLSVKETYSRSPFSKTIFIMGKRSNKRPVRYEKDQLGCMWGLITMFDFRHGRTTQRLLSHPRHRDGDEVGMGNSGNKLHMSTSSGEEKATVTDTCKPSVKKLLEEEMSRDQAAKKEVNHTELEAKQFGSGEGDKGRKNRKRNNTRKKSSGNSLDVDAAKKLVSEVHCQHKSEQQTTSNLYVDNIVEEFCREIDVSDGNKVSEASTRIVVLKPGPTSSKTPETGSSLGSSPECKQIIRYREPNEKVGSHFFLSEIKRKLKHAMGREQHRNPTGETSKGLSGERKNSWHGEGVKEYIGMNSPSKEHFFIERIVRKGENTSKLKGTEPSTDYETNDFSRHSNIYIEARKHLSELLTNEEDNVDLSSSQVRKTEIMVQEETKLLDASFETSDSSIARDDEIVDVSEVCDEKQYLQCSKQDLSEEDQQSFSLSASPSDTLVNKKVEGLEERPSPVSVLEPIFAEDVISPASIRSISGETSIQPLRIQFEEYGSLATNRSSRFKTCMDDKESIFWYIKAMLRASSFDWDELYIRSLSSDLLLDPLLLDEVEYLPNQLCHEKRLLFDCINEVLTEVCGYYFGSPGVSFVKTNIRPIPDMKNTIEEVCQGVYWHVLPMPLPRSLDKVVRKDMAKTGTWMDLRLDADFISVEIGEAILEDLLEDTITSYMNVNMMMKDYKSDINL